MQNRQYGLGVLLVLIGGLFLSGNGILLRLVEDADGWQILFYRGAAFSMTLLVILLGKYRGRTVSAFRDIGPHGFLRCDCTRIRILLLRFCAFANNRGKRNVHYWGRSAGDRIFRVAPVERANIKSRSHHNVRCARRSESSICRWVLQWRRNGQSCRAGCGCWICCLSAHRA